MPDRPYVILNAAMSLDGKIATRTGRAEISSPEDMERVQEIRASVDAIMIGINTLLVDDPSLRVKIPVDGPPPARVVVDSRLRTPPSARIFSYPGKIYLGTTSRAGPERRENMEELAEVITAGGHRVDLGILLSKLHEDGIEKLLLEGGGNLNWSMINGGLVDEIKVALSPVIIGGRNTVTLVEGEGAGDMSSAIPLQLVGVDRYGPDLVLTYKTGNENI